MAQREHEGEDGEDREHRATRQHLGGQSAGALAQVVEAVQDVGRHEGAGREAELHLHLHLLERHYAELREIWREHLAGDAPLAQRMPRAFDAWFAYL